jgi:hypothetical protein
VGFQSSEEVTERGASAPQFIRPLNSLMNKKSSIFPNMVTYVPIRRKDWVLKISIYKDQSVLIIGYNVYTFATCIRQFDDQNLAASFIDFLVEQEQYNG